MNRKGAKIAKKGRKRFVFQRPEDFRRLKNKFLTLGVLGVLAVQNSFFGLPLIASCLTQSFLPLTP
jgi:hypothetical protein